MRGLERIDANRVWRRRCGPPLRPCGTAQCRHCEFLRLRRRRLGAFLFLEMTYAPAGPAPVTERWFAWTCARAIARSRQVHTALLAGPASRSARHAIECSDYAEDPAQGFLPQAGRLLLYREPQGPCIASTALEEGLRVSGGTTTRCCRS